MYIDPGAGSVILQLILGAVLGGGVLIKVFWKKIMSMFSKRETNGHNGRNEK